MSDAQALWAWTVERYAWPEVKTACLRLQDELGLDVDIALWLAWRASRGERPTDAAWIQAQTLSDAMERDVLLPFRQARRAAAELGPLLGAEAAARLKRACLETELAIERAELDALAALPVEPGGVSDAQARLLSQVPEPIDEKVKLLGHFFAMITV